MLLLLPNPAANAAILSLYCLFSVGTYADVFAPSTTILFNSNGSKFLNTVPPVIGSTDSIGSTLVVSSDKLQFLENYGFNVVVLDSDTIMEATIKSNFKSERYKDIYLCSSDSKSDLIKELESNYKANIINVNMLYTLKDDEVNNNESYLTIMQDFIENIRNTALS